MTQDKDAEPIDELQVPVSPEAPGSGNGSATGGPEDPTAEEQNPVSDEDTEENEPLPRTWN